MVPEFRHTCDQTSEETRKDEDMNNNDRAPTQSGQAATKALLGVVFALGIAYPAGVAGVCAYYAAKYRRQLKGDRRRV